MRVLLGGRTVGSRVPPAADNPPKGSPPPTFRTPAQEGPYGSPGYPHSDFWTRTSTFGWVCESPIHP
ncbi:hypothetical protein GCM10010187_21200 [Actinomadura coerulea]|nr:hypothetical protein GCM10010187_21200 [Actinomadura coerulea]